MTDQKQTKNFAVEEYQYVHNLVLTYQKGTATEKKEALTELLKRFEPFLAKYKIFFYKKDFTNTKVTLASLRRFINLFIKNKRAKGMVNWVTYADGYRPKAKFKIKSAETYSSEGDLSNVGVFELCSKGIFDKTVTMIKNELSHLEAGDFENIIILSFINMCKNYKSEKPTFHNNVDKNFHFYLFRELQKESKTRIKNHKSNMDEFIMDLQTYGECQFIYNIEEEKIINGIDYQDVVIKKNLLIYRNNTGEEEYSIYEDSFLDSNWVNGDTCSKEFKCLTSFERAILVLWYIENMTDTQIGNLFSMARQTLNAKKNIARRKLESQCIKNRILKKDKDDEGVKDEQNYFI